MLAKLLELQQTVSLETLSLDLLLLQLLLHAIGKLLLGLLGLLLLRGLLLLGLLLGLMLLCRLHHLRIWWLGLARGCVRLRPRLSLPLPLLRPRCLV